MIWRIILSIVNTNSVELLSTYSILYSYNHNVYINFINSYTVLIVGVVT